MELGVCGVHVGETFDERAREVLEHDGDRVEHRVHGLPGPLLPRLPSGLACGCVFHRGLRNSVNARTRVEKQKRTIPQR
ncbi:hypothetical protein [Sandaracinus amylolyticus]|uniref:hypothetical protein n=1 Tax=Sandaracinus amylolyticus TaxID=927083 RepID=UPI001F33EDFA|nr:hypothetical protein [Sandaracinus amylolyticus]